MLLKLKEGFKLTQSALQGIVESSTTLWQLHLDAFRTNLHEVNICFNGTVTIPYYVCMYCANIILLLIPVNVKLVVFILFSIQVLSAAGINFECIHGLDALFSLTNQPFAGLETHHLQLS